MKRKRLVGLTVFGWLLIVKGLIIYSLIAISGIRRYSVVGRSELGKFGYFVGPLIFILIFSYVGYRILSLKKNVWRECVFLMVFVIIMGISQIIYGIGLGKLIGVAIFFFYAPWLYYFTRSNVKAQFE